MAKTITVRLYRHSDLDLMLLYNAYGKHFAHFASNCVKCFIRNIPPYFMAGVPDIDFIEEHENIVSSKYVGVSFSLTEDADVLYFLKNNIRYGYRNNFIKNILRFYAGKAAIAAYCATKDGFDYLRQISNPVAQAPVPISTSVIFPAPTVGSKPVSSVARTTRKKTAKPALQPTINETTPAFAPAPTEPVILPTSIEQGPSPSSASDNFAVFDAFDKIIGPT